MKHSKISKFLLVLGVIALLGIAVNSFAGWGPGYGYNLSDDEIEALEKERQAFFNDTEAIRQDLYAKDLELRSELAKENPDAKKAAQLQKEISKLEAQLDQKQIDHMIKMRKLSPNMGRGMGYMGRGGMGYGPGYGGGNCWR
jgi:zinc resistance-associated protein